MIIKPTTPKIYTPQDKSCVLNLDARDVRGSKIYDRSGKRNHGAITGAVIKPMNYGLPVLSLDGTDDYIGCGNDESLDITDVITISVWVKPNITNATQDIYHYGYNGGAFEGFYFGCRTGGIYKLRIGNGTSYKTAISATLYTTDWQHLVGTFDGTTIKLYRNSVQDPNTETQTGILNDTTVHANIGRATWDGYYFNGSIANVRIYNRALSASEISKMFNKLRHSFGI